VDQRHRVLDGGDTHWRHLANAMERFVLGGDTILLPLYTVALRARSYIHARRTLIFISARCNIYISRLCYDVSVRLSVRLSVTFVHCGHRVQWSPDTFACLDRWMSLLLTDNASPGSSDGMMPGFLEEEGRGHLALS